MLSRAYIDFQKGSILKKCAKFSSFHVLTEIFPEMKISDSAQDWIVLNVNTSGYYRINYDQNYWRRLAKVLEDDPKV